MCFLWLHPFCSCVGVLKGGPTAYRTCTPRVAPAHMCVAHAFGVSACKASGVSESAACDSAGGQCKGIGCRRGCGCLGIGNLTVGHKHVCHGTACCDHARPRALLHPLCTAEASCVVDDVIVFHSSRDTSTAECCCVWCCRFYLLGHVPEIVGQLILLV